MMKKNIDFMTHLQEKLPLKIRLYTSMSLARWQNYTQKYYTTV